MQGKRFNIRIFGILSVIMLIVIIFIVMGSAIALNRYHLHRLQRSQLLTHILLPGKTRLDVERWLGSPQREYVVPDNSLLSGVLVFLSHPRSFYGSMDIWILLDREGRILTVYFPDLQQDREAVKALLTLIPLEEASDSHP
jgi:hypothetical protein